MSSFIAGRLGREFRNDIGWQQYCRNCWVLLVYFPATILMRYDCGRVIEMDER